MVHTRAQVGQTAETMAYGPWAAAGKIVGGTMSVSAARMPALASSCGSGNPGVRNRRARSARRQRSETATG